MTMINLVILVLTIFSCKIRPVMNIGIPINPNAVSLLENKGLYSDSNYIVTLNADNLKQNVFAQKHATFLEFYNSYCGFCRRFAPHYKKLANEIKDWRNIIVVAAIDCAQDSNGDICREFEIMAYPTLRYFSPNYVNEDETKIGENVDKINPGTLKHTLIQLLISDETIRKLWPRLEEFNGQKKDLFENIPSNVKYVFVILEEQNDNSLLGPKVILNFYSSENIIIRRTKNAQFESAVDKRPALYVIQRNNMEIYNFSSVIKDEHEISLKIFAFLKAHNLSIPHSTDKTYPTIINDKHLTSFSDSMDEMQYDATNDRLNEINDYVFQADLEQALHFSLFNEISKFREIKGERLIALKQYLKVIHRYFPFGERGVLFLKDLRDFIYIQGSNVTGEIFNAQLNILHDKYKPIFSSNKWMACYSSNPGLRRFPCGLWLMFHQLTVRASKYEEQSDPLEVLHAIYGYIRYMFGCEDCSNHFQKLAVKNKIFDVSSKDDAILWLWLAHNEVNQRLAGDETEDHNHPKILFPSAYSCPDCRQFSGNILNDNEFVWNKTEVLFFLRKIHAIENISLLGVDNKNVLRSESIKSKKSSKIFSDFDIRIGMLLYIVCISIMIVAVKLFQRRGYRKKMYIHDILGKV